MKIQRGIFQGNALSPLLIVIVMMPQNHIGSAQAGTFQEKVNHLVHMNDIKVYAKNEKELEILR